jgi:hypothetical protein
MSIFIALKSKIMKSLVAIICSLFLLSPVFSQSGNAIFLHHSTGAGVFFEGNVAAWIADYNNENGTDLEITEFAYPDSPWGWENYPYDYWKLWVDGSCNNTQDNIQCLDKLCENNDLIIFKHCFPGAGIEADNGSGDVTSPDKTLNNYKLQYRALLELFDQYPDNKFMVWTLAPLHRNATNSEQAGRAAQFVDWVKNIWLTEDGNGHPNVFIFDFFGLVAEQDENPANGQQYCLKYDYEADHSGNDSHPNLLANETVGPLFAQSVVEILAGNTSGLIDPDEDQSLKISFDRTSKTLFYQLDESVQQVYKVDIYSIDGRNIISSKNMQSSGKLSLNIRNGVYLFQIKTGNTVRCRKIVL